MSQTQAGLEQLVEQAGQLYSLPAVALQVLELTSNPKVDPRELKQCIESDPALASKVLRVVNSSLFGLSQEVSNLGQALSLLGIKPLKLLVLGFSLPVGLQNGVADRILGRYWRRTLTKAVAARELAETIWRIGVDEPFIAALLHDLGQLVLIQQLGRPYITFLSSVEEKNLDLCALERQHMGFDHRELSARLLVHWGLPPTLASAMIASDSHEAHTATAPQLRSLAQVLHVADLVAAAIIDDHAAAIGEVERLIQAYGLDTSARLATVWTDLEQKVEQLAEVLSLELPCGRDYREIVADARSQLVEVAADAAGEMLRARLASRGDAPRESIGDSLAADLSAALASYAPRPVDALREMEEPSRAAKRAGEHLASRRDFHYAPRGRRGDFMPHGESLVAVADDDPALVGRLSVAVAACRQSRRPLSLLFAELDRFAEIVFAGGQMRAEELLAWLQSACQKLDHPLVTVLRVAEARFAVILADCDRQLAVDLGNQLVRLAETMTECQITSPSALVSVSVGASTVALPPKNFTPQSLIDSASRCLYAAQAGGGGSVKSIEMY